MTEILFSLALVVLTVALIAMSMTVKHLSDEIDELKEKLEFHRIKLQYVESCELDNEKRLDQLEDELGCMAYYNVKKILKNEQNI